VYLCSLIDDLELEIKGESAEVSGRSKVKMVGEDDVVISECELYLGFIDIEDIP
jgi:hypothetical protein